MSMQTVVGLPHRRLFPWPSDIQARFRRSGTTNCCDRRSIRGDGISLSFCGSDFFVADAKELTRWRYQQIAWAGNAPTVHASMLVEPATSVIRILVFYALLQTGIAGRGSRAASLAPASDEETSNGNGPFDWVRRVLLNEDSGENSGRELNKVRSKWHVSTKGTLVRRYRVPTKSQGKKLLGAVAQLLSDDDTFRDVATHKGCQIRRENAHAESVCCHNVRALFDELPTPHLVVEITVFPAGPITEVHYEKAGKIEKVLRTGQSI